MPTAGNVRFACECGKTYAWKPELAGKRAKCKCGKLIEVPATAPEPEAPQEPSLDDLYAVASQEATRPAAPPAGTTACPSCQNPLPSGAVLCVNCGYNLNTGAVHQITAAPAAPTAPAARKRRTRAGAAGAGAYPPSRRGLSQDAAESKASTQIMELYLPSGLLVFGTVLGIWRIMASGGMSLPAATALFAVWMVFEAVLVFVGCLIGIKWMGISLGEPLTALLKIGAVIVGPFGAALALSWLTGTWVVGFFVAPILYYALLGVFFEMDLGEVLLLSGVIYALQYIGRMLVLLALLNALFGTIPPAVAQIGGMALFGGGSMDEDEVDLTIVQRKPAADDKLTEDMMKADRYTMDVKTFFVNPNNRFATMKREDATALFEDLLARGATRVQASEINGYASRDIAEYTAQVMVVDLPADPSARKALFEKYNQVQIPRGYKEARDIGQKYLRFWTSPKQDKKKAAAAEDEDDA